MEASGLHQLAHRLAEEPTFAGVLRALATGHSGTIDGAWGSSKALALAGLLTAAPSTLVVVLPHENEIDQLAEDLRTFARVAPIILPPLDITGPESGSRRGDGDAFGKRLAICKTLAGADPPRVVLAGVSAWMQPVPTQRTIVAASRRVRVGQPCPRDELVGWLRQRGWRSCDAVELPGEFSVRGGILDVFPLDASDPFRLEFFGDDIESIREFRADSQRSLREVRSLDLTALGAGDAANATESLGQLADAVPKDAWFAFVEPVELREEGRHVLSRANDVKGLYSVDEAWAKATKFPSVVLSSLPFGSLELTCTLRVESVERFSGDIGKLQAELDRAAATEKAYVCCPSHSETARISELLKDSAAATSGRLAVVGQPISAGFRWVSANVVLIADRELFRRSDAPRTTMRKSKFAGRAIDSFLELRDGDFVVHLGHGIGMFRGMRMLEKNGQLEEHLQIEFADETQVYVPASKIELVQRYVGSNATAPRLSKIGGAAWEKRKAAVREAVRDLAVDLIDVQASREVQPGIAYPPDSEWQHQFEAAFPYDETPDQLTAIADIKSDMLAAKPMDRLICGDVGYGKTEVAMRAAFKAVDAGKQVAVLVPTTVLAMQHYRSFRDRMAGFPFVVDVISRFQSKGEQRKTLKSLASGGVDVLIGTHRLLSADVKFHDLGLVVIDEEQRFGVEPKEKLKTLRSQVDVLTMTATPIPRTLHTALVGIRDISNLETAPQDRMAVESRVTRFDAELIRHALLRELNRGGQAYFVHNRVQDIHAVRQRLQEIVPEARFAVLHGQMPEEKIEDGMMQFLERRADVLLATTIIESGLDIPSANTMFINDGERYGLADLHQLRGRVGRSTVRAYCYVLVDENKVLQNDALRRLKAIEEFSELGAGFKIALRDLEIRGAGNILGSQQSGHIAEVGYELYCQLLESAVRALKRLPLQSSLDVTIELPWQAYFPAEYLPGERFRIDAYRRLGRVRTDAEIAEFRTELEDRFGTLPAVAANLLLLAKLRALAQSWQIETIRPDERGNAILGYRNPKKMRDLAVAYPKRIRIVDERSAYVSLTVKEREGTALAKLIAELLAPITPIVASAPLAAVGT